MKSNNVCRLRVALLLAVFICHAASSGAQSSSTGALTGRVMDQTGAVIPGATVLLISSSTGQQRTTTTGEDGSYKFSLLPPGEYSLRFSVAGFKSAEIKSVMVNVTETPVRDANLEIGESTQEVTVTEATETLQTQTAAVGTLVGEREITAIPLTTRNYTQVLSLSSGVTTEVNNAAKLGKGTQDMTVNGNPTSANNYQMDGAEANVWSGGTAGDSATNQNGGISIPNPDAIAEFKIQTSLFDAGYGRNSGANVNVVTKSGTNELHGTAFEFVRNDVFNANEFFRNRAGQPRPVLKQNQFGGTIGGPVKKNKIFFFGAYQGTRQSNGLDPSALSNVALPPLTNDRSAATLGSQFCPANKPAALQSRYMTFAGGTQVACDGSNINLVALDLLNRRLPDGSFMIPTPQTIGSNSLGQSVFSIPSTFREDQFMVNTDWLISPKHTLVERYFYSRVPFTKSFSGGTVPGSPIYIVFRDDNANLKLTSVLTNNFVNEARVSFAQNRTNTVGLNIPTAASLGMDAANPFMRIPPGFSVLGNLGSFNFMGNTGNDWYGLNNQISWADQMSWVHGKQTMRFGGQLSKDYWHLDGIGRARGYLTFQNFTDFLLGLNASQNQSPTGQSNIFQISQGTAGNQQSIGPYGSIQPLMIAWPAHAFFQDDVKLSSNLTVNLGVRWEYIPGNYDRIGKAGNFFPKLAATVAIPPLSGTLVGNTLAANYNPNTLNPYTNQPFGPPPPGVVIRSTKTLYENNTPKDNFAPRIGFAWRPGDQSRLVLRGGYGWFYQTNGGNALDTAGLTTVPFAQRFTNQGVSAGFANLQHPFLPVTLGYVLRTPSSQLSDVVGGPHLWTPTVQAMSLNLQYQLVSQLVLEVGYVGQRSIHLLGTHGGNQPLLASANSLVNCGLPTSAAALGISASAFAALGQNSAGCITTNTVANAQFRVPIVGETPNALQGGMLDNNAWYHGLQTTLRKEFSHNLSFQAAYTHSKIMTDVSWMNDLTNRSMQWAPATYDRSHRLIVSYNYSLPNPFAKGLGSKLLAGWGVSGVTTAQTGTPLTLSDSRGGTVYGRAGASTIQFCSGMSNADLVTSGSTEYRLNNWFNKAAVCAPNVLPGGATDYGNSGQGIVRGPGQFNWDISLSKTTNVGGLSEKGQILFRAEFYNAFNHPQFSNPQTVASTASTFGVIQTTSVAPRLIQFGLKYIF